MHSVLSSFKSYPKSQLSNCNSSYSLLPELPPELTPEPPPPHELLSSQEGSDSIIANPENELVLNSKYSPTEFALAPVLLNPLTPQTLVVKFQSSHLYNSKLFT